MRTPLNDEDRVVTPAEDRERDDDTPHVDFAKEGEKPVGLKGGSGDSWRDGGNKAGDFGTVGEIRFAEFGGEKGFFASD